MSPAGWGRGDGRFFLAVPWGGWKIESRHNKQLRLQQKITADEEVLKNMNGVMKKIKRVVEEMEMLCPPPAPPPVGDKGFRTLKTFGRQGDGKDSHCR